MVVVSLAFIGIIVGALLMAAGYAYRLKLQDLNARDNFYYVEQAMNEIYAGVGEQTVKDMQDAYIYTVEHMVKYDFETNSYVSKTQEEAEEDFKREFIKNIQNNPFFISSNENMANELEKFISNDTVKLNKSNVYMQLVNDDKGNVVKIIIKNVTLTRTQDYSKSVANGAYTQTISTDIEIAEPDFSVLFNSTGTDYSNLFKYAVVADMGVEINQHGIPLTIAGNIYAASDYYNKRYNESTYTEDVSDSDKKYVKSYTVDGESVTIDNYTHGSVTSKKYSEATAVNDYYNVYSTLMDPAVAGEKDLYDGVNVRSMYSGLFINDSTVSILADTIIVPGSLAIMNNASLSIYGKDGKATSEAEVWTDNLVLGGYSTKQTVQTTTGADKDEYSGASAVIRANLYVKDDTELNSAGSNLQIRGSYYGYGDSTERDERIFIPTVKTENFQIEVSDDSGDTVTENRGHYNSSAIIVNGEQSTLDLSQTNTIYLAGRSYIELSKKVTAEEGTVTYIDIVNNETKVDAVRDTYEFTPMTDDLLSTDPDDTVFLRDYKTGESISLKSNQQAYIPIMYTGMPTAARDINGIFLGYWNATLHTALVGSDLFEEYFPESVFVDQIPCVMQEVSGKKYYYYDFMTAYDMMKDSLSGNALATFTDKYQSAQFYASHFIADYVAEINNEDSVIAEFLTDIGDYEDFEAGDIILPDSNLNPNVTVYSSGAITSKANTKFDIVTSDDFNDVDQLLSSTPYNNGFAYLGPDDQNHNNAYQFSNNFEMEYDLVKWNLGHYKANDIETTYIKELVADTDYGDGAITPINKFLNFDTIKADTNIRPKLVSSDTSLTNGVLDLDSKYSVWISNEDVTVSSRAGVDGAVIGMVITKGDVYFDNTVKSFEGIVISGGKVYVNNRLFTITANDEICRTILRECQLSQDEKCKIVLNLFKGYEVEDDGPGGIGEAPDESEVKSIENIDYSDVVRFNNWMKNVE